MSAQESWKWCRHCQVVYFGGAGHGQCAGKPHDPTGSGPYVMYFGGLSMWHQGGWRWCRRCQSLVFSQVSRGACFAGGQHDWTGSAEYCVVHNADLPNGLQRVHQRGWRWCNRCQALFYSELGAGVCPAGGGHDGGGSGKYQLASIDKTNPSDMEIFKQMGDAKFWEDWSRDALGDIKRFFGG